MSNDLKRVEASLFLCTALTMSAIHTADESYILALADLLFSGWFWFIRFHVLERSPKQDGGA